MYQHRARPRPGQLIPRIEPAIIVVVQSPGPPPRGCSAVTGALRPTPWLRAGFADLGERLDDAVRREVGESLALESARFASSDRGVAAPGRQAGYPRRLHR